MKTFNNNFKIVFIHGWGASSKVNFYPELSKKLGNLNIKYEIPDLPGGDYPKAETWLVKMHEVISKIKGPIVLVGHSLGTRAILLYLEKYMPANIRFILLIAVFGNSKEEGRKYDEPEYYSNFFENKIDLEKIKNLSKFVAMHSEDDLLEINTAKELAKDLDAKIITYKDMSHFSDDPRSPEEILKVLKEELKF